MNSTKAKDHHTTPKPNSPIKVAVVDDDVSFLATMKLLFNTSKEFQCIGAYHDPRIALREIVQTSPDVVLMDIRMDGASSGIECARRLKQALPAVGIIMVTSHQEAEMILKSFIAGANGYVLKPAKPEEYREAVRQVLSRRSVLAEPMLTELLHTLRLLDGGSRHGLTAREWQVLLLWAQNKSDKEIAQALNISPSTVHAHSTRIFAKLAEHSRAEAAEKFLLLD